MKKVTLVNPWSNVDTDAMTWEQIKAWCEQHIHQTDRAEWLKRAKAAFDAGNGETLGAMIIGS